MKIWLRCANYTPCSWLTVLEALHKAFHVNGDDIIVNDIPDNPSEYVEIWWGNPAEWTWSGLPVRAKIALALSEARSIQERNRDRAISNLQISDIIICPSYAATMAYTEAPLDKPIHFVLFGVDDREFHYIDRRWGKPISFLHGGVMQFRKGSWMVPEAFVAAFGKSDMVKLAIETPEHTSMFEQMKREYGNNPNIEFLCERRPSPLDVYKNHQIYISPHLSEGFGLMPLEAMATGMACIISRCSAPNEYFSKDFGWWIEMSESYVPISQCLENTNGFWRLPDVKSLSNAMNEVYNDIELAKEKGVRASKYVLSEMTWEDTIKDIKGIIEQFLSIHTGYTINDNQGMTNRRYLYVPSKTPMNYKDTYTIFVIMPYIFLGGAEMQMEYLLDELLANYPYQVKIILEDTVDEHLYPRWMEKYDCIQLTGINKSYKLFDMLRETQPDIVLYHGTSILADALSGLLYKPICIQIAHTAHGKWTTEIIERMGIYGDHIITVATWLRSKFQPLYNHRFTAVLNGVPYLDEAPCEEKESITLGLMSRLVGGKGMELLLDSMKHMPENVSLLIAGWGPLADIAKHRAASDPRITFMGTVTEHDAFWDAVDVAVLPSDAEGNSMFLLEAGMRSKAIIATPVGAVPELFQDAESALIIEPTIDSIVDAVTQLLDNDFRAALSHGAYIAVMDKAACFMAQGYYNAFMSELSRRVEPQSIVLYREYGRGDVLMTVPSLRFLRRRYPTAKITYLLPPSLYPVLAELKEGVEVVECTGDKQYLDFAAKSDVAIRFQHDAVWDSGEHIIDHYLAMVGCDTQAARHDYRIDVDHIQFPDKYENLQPYACIHSRSSFQCKDWGTPAQWRSVVNSIQGRGITVIAIGGSDQPDWSEWGVLPAHRDNLTPAQTMRLLRDAAFFIGIDSFPLHAATVVGCPAVCIYAGANPPTMCGYEHNINVVSPMNCRCDGTKGHGYKCPHDHACLKYITTQDVIDAVKQIL